MDIKEWFKDKKILITGASSGIGKEFARQLSSYGSDLLLCGRNKDSLDKLTGELKKNDPQKVCCCSFDLSNNDECSDFIKKVQADYSIDILINNAGFGCMCEFGSMDDSLKDSMLFVNVNSVTTLCRAFLPDMIKKGKGGILNVGSTASFFATPGSALYGATKHFIRGFTDALHWEMRTKGIHVTGLYPGHVHTGFIERASLGKRKVWKTALEPSFVAWKGLMGLYENKRQVIPGMMNYVKVFASRILPHEIIMNKIYTETVSCFKE